jgi:hypothetical protein
MNGLMDGYMNGLMDGWEYDNKVRSERLIGLVLKQH